MCLQCRASIPPIDGHVLCRDCLPEEHFVSKEITCENCAALVESTYRGRRHSWLARQASSFVGDSDIEEFESPLPSQLESQSGSKSSSRSISQGSWDSDYMEVHEPSGEEEFYVREHARGDRDGDRG